jgi:hypothetical protein
MNFLFIMAITVQIIIRQDMAGPALTALQGVMTVKQLSKIVGEAEVILFQKHFQNAPSNKQGYPSTGFWKDAARATNYQATNAGVVISVNQVGVRQRYQGGDIFPVNGKYLAIPARAETYGKTPREFDNLTVAFGRNGPYALVEAAATKVTLGRKSRGTAGVRSFDTQVTGGLVMFWLVKSASQKPDPTVLPDERDIQEVAKETIDAVIERVGNGGKA